MGAVAVGGRERATTVTLSRVPAGVFIIAGLVVLALLLVADRYGYLGDEFYFVVTGRHLQFAAPDNPMLVPYLAAAWYAIVGGHLWGFRILPALVAGGYVLLGGLVAREFGAPRSHQVAAAAAVALSALTLAVGHLFGTTTFDILVTAATLWMLVRALRAEPQHWAAWIGVGVLAGVAMEIKILVAPLLACCLLGVVVFGPRRRLADLRPWIAALIAFTLAAPNLIWQATHGLPMASVAANIASGGSTSSTPRAALLPTVLLGVGPVLSIVLVVGLVVLLRTRERRMTDGWLAAGYLIFVVFLLLTGAKAYYPAGFYPALLAAGAGPTLEWVRIRPWRRVLAVALVIISLVITPSFTLPLGPVGSPLYKIDTSGNPDLANEVGWPGFVDTVGEVAATVPASELGHVIVLTETYQEAGALELLRPANGVRLPSVHSGHNGFWYWGPPPDSATDAVLVGDFPPAQLSRWYARCEVRSTVASPPGVSNDLTGIPVRLCTGRLRSWSVLWPELQLLA
jgi:4-amino-4-deoxy-L-arabinose transferase-like glycosyltransferase